MVIFEYSSAGRTAALQSPTQRRDCPALPEVFLRKHAPRLPEVSELDVVRHFTTLSQQNFSIDSHFYPLGSCTMKYNPRGAHAFAMHPRFLQQHPYTLPSEAQGMLQVCAQLQDMLRDITGMPGVSLAPMAGAQGEFAGVAMIRAYHRAREDDARCEILVPDAAHGTNPASAVMCGFKVREIPTTKEGDVDLEQLRAVVGPQTAGIMLTNPSTLGVFEREIETIAQIVHDAGGLLYYDGANLNAILGRVRPGDMGFDVVHLNLHKTFATPHGGGGPGAGPIAVGEKLLPFLPVPFVVEEHGQYRWIEKEEQPQSIGRLTGFMGNMGVLLRAYAYMRFLGAEGMRRVSTFATLNANYLMERLRAAGFTLAYPHRRATHEFIINLSSEKKKFGVTAMDFAKRLLDYGVHAPTTYFPLLVPECFLIEPTETESKQTLDRFVDAMVAVRSEAEHAPEKVKTAPHTLPVKRLDDVKAVKELNITYYPIT